MHNKMEAFVKVKKNSASIINAVIAACGAVYYMTIKIFFEVFFFSNLQYFRSSLQIKFKMSPLNQLKQRTLVIDAFHRKSLVIIFSALNTSTVYHITSIFM